uniref:Uncharacterized protein TCIL3000_10_6490 n=1 Tax=Trypanosoma congolense (strain IL3000) TaxID=1068625 RepID=G0UWV9_TRYCI|nr:unnamed protein product [Trypanosoma congolense IL3000]
MCRNTLHPSRQCLLTGRRTFWGTASLSLVPVRYNHLSETYHVMKQQLSRTAIARLIDAFNIQRKTALLSLLLKSESEVGGGAGITTREASPPLQPSGLLRRPLELEQNVLPFVRDTFLGTMESGLVRAAREGVSPGAKTENGNVMEGRRLVSLDLACTRLSTSFNRCDLSNAIFIDALVDHCTFNLASMACCNLAGAQFHSCTFLATDAVGIDARRGRFSYCNFCRANMIGWDVRGATFYRCSFALCDMSQWVYDGQTTVVEPVSWERCRRTKWMKTGTNNTGEFRVVRGTGKGCGLSLPPRDDPS